MAIYLRVIRSTLLLLLWSVCTPGCHASTNSSDVRIGRILQATARQATPATVSAVAGAHHTNQQRKLLEGLECDLQIYESFIDSEEGQDTFIMATMCESRIMYIKNVRAGAYDPVEQVDLRFTMCSDECTKSVGEYVYCPRLLPRELGAPALHAPGRVRPLGLRARGLHVHALRVGQALHLHQQRARGEYSAARGLLHGAAIGHVEKIDRMGYPFEAWESEKIMIAWKVLASEELLYEGAFAASLATNSDGDGLEYEASTRGVQLVPTVREKACALLLQVHQQSEHESGGLPFIEFSINRDALAVDRTDDRMESTNAVSNGRTSEWFCRLELRNQKQLNSLEDKKSWFEIKVQRAGECRVRGNDAFKREKYKAAIRLYKKALRWLECPADCTYDHDEAAVVDPIALACHSNLATSFWKLENAEKCIEHATLALGCDPQSVKALFRRSQAFVQTKAFDDAVRDLETANQLESENKLVRSALERARAAQTQFNTKQKQAFAKIF